MNTDTGVAYRGDAEIAAARERGEPVVSVSETVADAVEAGMRATDKCCPGHAGAVNRQERRKADRTCPLLRRRRG